MRERFETLAVKNAGHPLAPLMEFVGAGEFTANGTVAQWMKAHHGERIDTIQIQPHSSWAPMSRMIDSQTKKTEVLLKGQAGSVSGREYRGMTVLHADENRLVAKYDFGGESWVAYQIAD